MIKKNFKVMIALLSLVSILNTANAQTDKNNAITTAVPFLSINPDARAGAMGYAGLATKPDANGLFANAAKMAFIENTDKEGNILKEGNNFGVALTFIPWLRGIANDVYMADLAGYYNIRSKKNPDIQQSIATSLRFFSLGNIKYTDLNGVELGQGNPVEFAFDVHYARKFHKNLSVGIGLRFIHSNIGTLPQEQSATAGNAAAGDISLFYSLPIEMKKGLEGMRFNFGTAFTNIGSKMSYSQSGNVGAQEFIPANWGLGAGLEMDIDKHNSINVYFDANKLLVPTPDTTDANGDGTFDYKAQSSIAGVFTSFGDAPGGAAEEMKEFTLGGGVEYAYNNLFFLRLGGFYEAESKGNRRFLSAGAGVKYSIFTLNAAYIIPTSPTSVNPIDNTMYFSLLFNFNHGKKQAKAPAESNM